MGYYSPKSTKIEHDQIWAAINKTLHAISGPLEEAFNAYILPTNESKTERILSAIAQAGVTNEQIIDLNLKPWEFLETLSPMRKKTHDETRSVNLLGRLNRLFYHQDRPLPSLKELHFLAQQEI
jgi:hypothetical protein